MRFESNTLCHSETRASQIWLSGGMTVGGGADEARQGIQQSVEAFGQRRVVIQPRRWGVPWRNPN